MNKRFLTLAAVATLCFGVIVPSVGAINVLATDNNAATTTKQKLDPANLADGKYTIDAPLMKEGKDTASLAQSYFDKKADLSVKDGKYSLTLHLIKNKSMVSDVSTVSDNKAATVTSTGDQTEDITFDVTNLTDVTTLALVIHIIPTMNMPQKMDVKPDVSTLTADTTNTDQSTATSDSQTASASSSATASSAVSESSNSTATQPTTNESSTETTSTNETTGTDETENTDQTTPVLPTDPITSTDPTTTPTDPTDDSDPDTSLTQAPLFDPANLSDGTYQVPVNILKTGTSSASLASDYFSDNATVVVTDNATKVNVTLHVIKNASLITTFSIGANDAVISNKTSTSEDLTFNVDNQFSKPTVTANMTITIPGLNKAMTETADLQFASALYTAPTTTTDNNSGETTTGTPAATGDQTTSNNSVADLPTFDPTNLKDGQYKVDASILQANSDSASVAASFFNPYATVTVSNDTKTVKVTLHVIKNASTIEKFALDDQTTEISNQTTDSEDLTFTVNDSFNNAIMNATMTIKIPVLNTQMNEEARVEFGTALYNSNATDNNSNTGTPNQSGTTTDNNDNDTSNSTASSIADLPTFDPTNLKDGQYKINASILKADTDDASVSASFFDPYATVTVSNNTKTITVTLHVIKNAATIASFSLGGQAAQVTNQTTASEDLTFTVDDTFKDAIMNAAMTIKIPVLNTQMNEQARVKFGTALLADTDNSNTGTTTNNAGTTVSTPKQNTNYNIKNPKDGTYKIQAPIMSASDSTLQTPSAAQKFIAKTATIIVSNNGTKIQLLLHVTSGANYIKKMSIAGQLGKMINKNGNSADLIFNISKTTLLGIGKVEFNLVTPLGSMNEPAYIIFNLSNKSLSTYKTQIATTTALSNNQHGIIDTSKAVQYVPYKVLDSSKTSLSTANNYYTKSAKVVKTGSGYDVYLTVKETAGMVQFTPLSINNGGIMDASHSTTGGQDVWSYAFHVANANGLDNLIPAQIKMSVPIAQITNQYFNIWLSFGKAQTGGTDYLNSDNNSALPASTLALVNSGNNNASPTLLANTPTNRKKLAAANNGKNSTSANDKLTSVKQYPLIAEIAGFSVIALGIIGFTFYKKYRG